MQLNDVSLRQQVIDLELYKELRLEAGTIGGFGISIPWTQIRLGTVNMNAHKVRLVFRLKVLNDSKVYAEVVREKIRQQRRKDLGQLAQKTLNTFEHQEDDSAAPQPSWVASYFGKVLEGYIRRVAAQLHVTFQDLDVTFLLPTVEGKHTKVQLHIKSLVVEPADPANVNEYDGKDRILSKQVRLSELSASIEECQEAMDDDYPFSNMLRSRELTCTVLSPLRASLSVSLYQDEEGQVVGNDPSKPPVKPYHVEALARFDSVELVASPEQICAFAEALAVSETKPVWQELIKYYPKGGELTSRERIRKRGCRQLWQFAIYATIDIIRAGKMRGRKLDKVIVVMNAGRKHNTKYIRQWTLARRPPGRFRAWWHYAIQAVLRLLRKARREGGFGMLTSMLLYKARYASFYSRLVGSKILARQMLAHKKECSKVRASHPRHTRRPVRIHGTDVSFDDSAQGDDNDDDGTFLSDGDKKEGTNKDDDTLSSGPRRRIDGDSDDEDSRSSSSSSSSEEESFHLIRTPIKAIRTFFTPGGGRQRSGSVRSDSDREDYGGDLDNTNTTGSESPTPSSPGSRASPRTPRCRRSPGGSTFFQGNSRTSLSFNVSEKHKHMLPLSARDMSDLEDCYTELSLADVEVLRYDCIRSLVCNGFTVGEIRQALREVHESELLLWHKSLGALESANREGIVLASEKEFLSRTTSAMMPQSPTKAGGGGGSGGGGGDIAVEDAAPSVPVTYDCRVSMARVGVILLAMQEDSPSHILHPSHAGHHGGHHDPADMGTPDPDAWSAALGRDSERETMLQFVVYGIELGINTGDELVGLMARFTVSSMHVYDSGGEMASVGGCHYENDLSGTNVDAGSQDEEELRTRSKKAVVGTLEIRSKFHESDVPDVPGVSTNHFILPIELDTWSVTVRPTSLTGVTSVMAKIQSIFTVESIVTMDVFDKLVKKKRQAAKLHDDYKTMSSYKDQPKIHNDKLSIDFSLHGVNFKLPHTSESESFSMPHLMDSQQMMLLNIGFISFKLGDFIADDFDAEMMNGSFRANHLAYVTRHKKLMEGAKGNEALAAGSLSILDVSLMHVSSIGEHHSVFTTPLDLQVAMVSSLYVLNPDVTGLEVDVWASSLSLSFTSDDMTAIIDSVEDIKLLLPGVDGMDDVKGDTPVEAVVEAPSDGPARISSLAALKMSEINFELTSIDVSLLKDSKPAIYDTIRSMLRGLGICLLKGGYCSRAFKVECLLTMQRLRHLGLSGASASSELLSFRSAMDGIHAMPGWRDALVVLEKEQADKARSATSTPGDQPSTRPTSDAGDESTMAETANPGDLHAREQADYAVESFHELTHRLAVKVDALVSSSNAAAARASAENEGMTRPVSIDSLHSMDSAYSGADRGGGGGSTPEATRSLLSRVSFDHLCGQSENYYYDSYVSFRATEITMTDSNLYPVLRIKSSIEDPWDAPSALADPPVKLQEYMSPRSPFGTPASDRERASISSPDFKSRRVANRAGLSSGGRRSADKFRSPKTAHPDTSSRPGGTPLIRGTPDASAKHPHDSAALVFEMFSVDKGFEMGTGGYDEEAIFDETGMFGRRHSLTKTQVICGKVIVLLSPSGLLQQAQGVVPAMNKVSEYWEAKQAEKRRQRKVELGVIQEMKMLYSVGGGESMSHHRDSPHTHHPRQNSVGTLRSSVGSVQDSVQEEPLQQQQPPPPPPPAVDLKVSVDSVTLYAANEGKLLAEVTLKAVQVRMFNGALDVQVSLLELYDLTFVNVRHERVIWSNRGKKRKKRVGAGLVASPIPLASESSVVVSVSCAAPDPDAEPGGPLPAYVINVNGLRYLFVMRFLTEVLTFASAEMFSPLMDIFKPLTNPTVAEVSDDDDDDVSDDESDMREEDEVNFDTSSSEDGSDDDEHDSPNHSRDDLSLDSNEDSGSDGSDPLSSAAERVVRRLLKSSKVEGRRKIEAAMHEAELEAAAKKDAVVVPWSVEALDLVVYIPRNSRSDEMLALAVKNLGVGNVQADRVWTVIREAKTLPSPMSHIYFDPRMNEWMVHEVPTEVPAEASHRAGRRGAGLRREERRESAKKNADNSYPLDGGGRGRSSSVTSLGSGEEVDRPEVDMRLAIRINTAAMFVTLAQPHRSGGGGGGGSSSKQRRRGAEVPKPRDLLDPENGGFLTRYRDDGKSNKVGVQQMWRRINPDAATNLMIVLDYVGEALRTLVGDTRDRSTFHLDVTMAEFFLVMSVYFDNILEPMEFFPPLSLPDMTPKNPPHHKYGNQPYSEYLGTEPGVTSFLLALHRIKLKVRMETGRFSADPASFYWLEQDILEARKKGLNEESIRKVIHFRDSYEVAEITLDKAVVHVEGTSNLDLMRVSVVCGFARVMDCRRPEKMSYKEVLHVALPEKSGNDNHGTNRDDRCLQGYSDQTWALRALPSQCGDASLLDMPLKVSYIACTTSNWATLTVGVSHANAFLKNLEMVQLLTDIFALYFIDPSYGNPTLPPLNEPIEEDFGGMDIRVFITHPCVVLPQAGHSHSMPLVVLETNKGVYYRQLGDALGSTKLEVRGNDLELRVRPSLALHLRKLPEGHRPFVRRPREGGSMSRVLVEALDLVWSESFDALDNHSDVVLKIWSALAGRSRGTGGSGSAGRASIKRDSLVRRRNSGLRSTFIRQAFVDLNSDPVRALATPVVQPRVTAPLLSPVRALENAPVILFVSYEDVMLVMALVNELLVWPPEEDDEDRGEATATETSAGAATSASATGASARTGGGRLNLDSTLDTIASEEGMIAPGRAKARAPATFTLIKVDDLCVTLTDHVLGRHLPFLQFFVDNVHVTIFNEPALNRELAAAAAAASAAAYTNEVGGVMRNRTRTQSSDDAHASGGRDVGSSLPFVQNMSPSFDEHPSFDAVRERPHSIGKKGHRRSTSSNSFDDVHAGGKRGHRYSTSFDDDQYAGIRPENQKRLADGAAADGDAEQDKDTLKVAAVVRLWGDYFNQMLKCWEPLCEPIVVDALYEVHPERGAGLNLRTLSAVHFNVSGRLLFTVNEMVRELSKAMAEKKDDDAAAVAKAYKEVDEEVLRKKSMVMRGSVLRGEVMGGNDSTSNRNKKNTLSQFMEHRGANHLHEDARIPFSILNSTGQPLRFLQEDDQGGSYIIRYLVDGKRGTLKFTASQTSIRNSKIFEKPFEAGRNESDPVVSHLVSAGEGEKVAMQLCGMQWLHGVRVDDLGIRFSNLDSVLGLENASKIISNESVLNALMLVSEVLPCNGGRMLNMRSTFTVINQTNHDINLLLNPQYGTGVAPTEGRVEPEKLKGGESFHVPVLLLRQSLLQEPLAQSMGHLWLQPSSLEQVKSEIGDTQFLVPSRVAYSRDSLSFLDIVRNGGKNVRGGEKDALLSNALSCDIDAVFRGGVGGRQRQQPGRNNKDSGNQKLPSFRYAVEIVTTKSINYKSANDSSSGKGSKSSNMIGGLFSTFKGGKSDDVIEPMAYFIIIHPPFYLENFLPFGGVFELRHATENRSLWSSWIDAGMAMPIHTVPLDVPVLLFIHLRFCKSLKGTMVHVPVSWKNTEKTGLLDKINQQFSSTSVEVNATASVTDSTGQTLRVQVENTQGKGGQRHIVVFCPFWVLNTSQYAIRVKHNGRDGLPAGSVSDQLDGSRVMKGTLYDLHCVPGVAHQQQVARGRATSVSPRAGGAFGSNRAATSQQQQRQGQGPGYNKPEPERVMLGKPGPLHSSIVPEFSTDDHYRQSLLGPDIPFESTVDMVAMFNFHENDDFISILNADRVCVQLDDSDWSSPLSLDSVGVDQTVEISHYSKRERGFLEIGVHKVGFRVTTAPGRLAKYTRVVRFSPGMVFVNKLPRGVRLLQPRVGFRDRTAIHVSPSMVHPFFFPNLHAGEKLMLSVEGPFHLTPAVGVDALCRHTMNLTKRTDLSTTAHVSTRSMPEYSLEFPPIAELGIWFETDLDSEDILVKDIRKDLYAGKMTDIQIGDVLLSLDGHPYSGPIFEQFMLDLKDTLAHPGTRMRFRTHEEKLRLIRSKAAMMESQRTRVLLAQGAKYVDLTKSEHMDDGFDLAALKLDMSPTGSTTFVVASPVAADESPYYRVENNTSAFSIFYKQKCESRRCERNRWTLLRPGTGEDYVWDDPVGEKIIMVRLGRNILSPTSDAEGQTQTQAEKTWSLGGFAGIGVTDLTPAVFIKMDKLGEVVEFPAYDAHKSKIFVQVKSYGLTKTLHVMCTRVYLPSELSYCAAFARGQLDTLEKLEHKILVNVDSADVTLKDSTAGLRSMQTQLLEDERQLGGGDNVRLSSGQAFVSTLGPTITRKNQLSIDIVEARELKAFMGENVYCKVYLKIKSSDRYTRLDLLGFRQRKTTVPAEQTLDPLWEGQRFIYDIPAEAIDDRRSYSLRIKVKNKTSFSMRSTTLGVTDVQFVTNELKKEHVLQGWFPLRSQNNRSYPEFVGSIKMRLQWVVSDDGLKRTLQDAIDRRRRELRSYNRVILRRIRDLEAVASAVPVRQPSLDRLSISSTAGGSSPDAQQALGLGLEHGIEMMEAGARGAIVPSTSAQELSHDFHDAHGQGDHDDEHDFDRDDDNDCDSDSDSGSEEEEDHTTRRASTRFGPQSHATRRRSSVSMAQHNLHLLHGAAQRMAAVRELTHISTQQMARLMETTGGLRTNNTHLRGAEAGAGADDASAISIPPSPIAREQHSVDVLNNFTSRFDEEALRAFSLVHSTSGMLEITPIQSLYLPESRSRRFVRVRYAGDEQKTFSIPPASTSTWADPVATHNRGHQHDDNDDDNDNDDDDDDDEAEVRREKQGLQLTKLVEVDTLNIMGGVSVSVMVEGFPNDIQIGRLDLLVLPLLSAICGHEKDGVQNQVYDRWFPLYLSKVETGGPLGPVSKRESHSPASFENQPHCACIRLAIRWRPTKLGEGSRESDGNTGAYVKDRIRDYARIRVPELSLCVIDSDNARDVMHLSINEIDLRHSNSVLAAATALSIWHLQISNQLSNAADAVILCPAAAKAFEQPIIRARTKKNHQASSATLIHYDNIDVAIQALDLNIEQRFISVIAMVINDWIKIFDTELTVVQRGKQGTPFDMPTPAAEKAKDKDDVKIKDVNKDGKKALKDGNRDGKDGAPANKAEETYKSTDNLYIERFYIGPVQINVSIIMASGGGSGGGQKTVHRGVISTTGVQQSLTALLRHIGEVALAATSSITDAPICLAACHRRYVFMTVTDMTSYLQKHYTTSILGQFYKIMGSLDLVGNPVRFLSSLGYGVNDLFYEPAMAIIHSPTDIRKIGTGIFKGAQSLVSNTADGTMTTVTTLSRGLGETMLSFILDDTFIHNREVLQKESAEKGGARDSFVRPLKDIGNGLYCGITGIVREPVVGAYRQGIRGVLIGTVGGLLGVAIKPTVGLMDSLAHFVGAIRTAVGADGANLTTFFGGSKLSNTFGPDGRLLPFNKLRSFGHEAARRKQGHVELLTGAQEEMDTVFEDEEEEGFGLETDEEEAAAAFANTVVAELEEKKNKKAKSVKGRLVKFWKKAKSAVMHGAQGSSKEVQGSGRDGATGRGDRENSESNSGLAQARKKRLEFIVYTTALEVDDQHQQQSGSAMVMRRRLVVLTSRRLFVLDYTRASPSGMEFFTELFKCAWDELAPPALGGLTSLTLTCKDEVERRKKVARKFILVGGQRDSDTLVRIHNICHIMLDNFDDVLPVDKAAVDDMTTKDGIITIGPFEFAAKQDLGANHGSTSVRTQIIDELQTMAWFMPYSPDDRAGQDDHRHTPVFMATFITDSVDAHGNINICQRAIDKLTGSERFSEQAGRAVDAYSNAKGEDGRVRDTNLIQMSQRLSPVGSAIISIKEGMINLETFERIVNDPNYFRSSLERENSLYQAHQARNRNSGGLGEAVRRMSVMLGMGGQVSPSPRDRSDSGVSVEDFHTMRNVSPLGSMSYGDEVLSSDSLALIEQVIPFEKGTQSPQSDGQQVEVVPLFQRLRTYSSPDTTADEDREGRLTAKTPETPEAPDPNHAFSKGALSSIAKLGLFGSIEEGSEGEEEADGEIREALGGGGRMAGVMKGNRDRTVTFGSDDDGARFSFTQAYPEHASGHKSRGSEELSASFMALMQTTEVPERSLRQNTTDNNDDDNDNSGSNNDDGGACAEANIEPQTSLFSMPSQDLDDSVFLERASLGRAGSIDLRRPSVTRAGSILPFSSVNNDEE